MSDEAAQREFTRLYREYIKAMRIEQQMLERYWPDNPVLNQGRVPSQSVGSSTVTSRSDDDVIDLDAK
jgi:hypothetical protein